MLEPKMVIPIGTPVYDPAIPTSGADKEPRTNGNKPNKAEALPAICPCDSIANAKEVVPIILIDRTKKKIGIATAMIGAFKRRAISKHAPAKLEIPNPIFKKVRSDILSVKRPTD